MKVEFPSVAEVARHLRLVKQGIEGEADVRLQVMPDGTWSIHVGDASYDQDHRGFWGAGTLGRRSNCRDLARDLLEEAKDQEAMTGDVP